MAPPLLFCFAARQGRRGELRGGNSHAVPGETPRETAAPAAFRVTDYASRITFHV
jgi:hypothetical protein